MSVSSLLPTPFQYIYSILTLKQKDCRTFAVFLFYHFYSLLMLISSFSRKSLNLLTVSRAITARVSSDHIKQFGQICTLKRRPLVTRLPAVVSLWHISQFIISPLKSVVLPYLQQGYTFLRAYYFHVYR